MLDEEERVTRKVHCSHCEVLIDFSSDPPQIVNKEEYVELLTSLNQGDIALIKSILENSDIKYFTTGENFLSVDPLIQPARFSIHQEDIDSAKEVLQDFKLHIWGTSSEQEE